MPEFPKPTGPYAVGCSDLVSKCGPDRCLFRIFYPATESKAAKNAYWLPDTEYADGFLNIVRLGAFSRIFQYFFADACMHALINADLEKTKRTGKMPVVLFSHGMCGNRTMYSHVCIELASKGALVASLEHADESATTTYYLEQDDEDCTKFNQVWIPYRNVPNNHPHEHRIRNGQVHKRADECTTALNHLEEINQGAFSGVATEIDLSQFQDQLDLDKVAILGHSFGGATAVATLSKDTRFKVGVGLDSWMFPLDKQIYRRVAEVPFLFVNAYSFQWAGNVAGMRKMDSDTFNMNVERRIVTIADSNHVTQTDFSLLMKWNWFSKLCKLHSHVDPEVLMKVNHELIGAFIGKHLDLEFGAELDNVAKQYKQHVIMGSNIELDEEKVKESKQKLIA